MAVEWRSNRNVVATALAAPGKTFAKLDYLLLAPVRWQFGQYVRRDFRYGLWDGVVQLGDHPPFVTRRYRR